MKISESNERIVIKKYVDSLRKEFAEINLELINIHDSDLYEKSSQKLYDIAWDALKNKYARKYFPETVLDIFIAAFRWATVFYEGISVDMELLSAKQFKVWLSNISNKNSFGDKFNDSLFDLGKFIDTSRVIGSWTTVVNYIKLSDGRYDPLDYFHLSISNYMMIKDMPKYEKNRSLIELKLGEQSIRIISMILSVNGKDAFEKVFDGLSEHKIYMRKYIEYDPMMVSRLFSSYALNLYKGKSETSKNKTFFHYTSVSTLYDIIYNKRIKMSYSKNYLDDDEGKMFRDNPMPIFSLSMTKNGDSVALWGNYTNNKGVAIEVDAYKFVNSFSGIDIKTKNPVGRGFVSYKPFFKGNVIYGEHSKNLLIESFNAASKYFKDICSEKTISVLEKWFYGIQTHFAKVKPFEYEEEFRLLIPEETVKDQEIYGGNVDGGLYLDIEPSHLFKRIIVAPTLKVDKYELKNLKNLLKENGMENLIDYSKATINPK